MNCPKTNTYPKHYVISDHGNIPGAICPKPWHPVFVSQVLNLYAIYAHNGTINILLPFTDLLRNA